MSDNKLPTTHPAVLSSDPSWEEFGAAVRQKLEEAREAATILLQAAIEVGELLLQARELGPKGEFEEWLDHETGLTYATANRYMRLAHYREHLEAEAEQYQTVGKPFGINAAQTALKGLPPIPSIFGRDGRVATEADKELAAELRAEGKSYRAIADVLDRDAGTVYYWLNPTAQRKNTERGRRARRLAREERNRRERDQAARKAGGSLHRAYSGLRRATADLDQAIAEAKDDHARQYLRAARNNLYLAEDRIAAALDVE